MLEIEQPDDLISISLYNVLTYRKDEEFINLVKDWNKTIVIHIIPFYPVTVIFEGNKIKFERGEVKKANLKLKLEIDAMLDMANGRLGPVGAMLKGKLRIKGMSRVGTLLKFTKIFMKTMKMVAADPEIHFYEKKRIKQ
ncbi:MAG: SCP2 sterol-binding domain-containing protein [Promethearchaeota archaeon]